MATAKTESTFELLKLLRDEIRLQIHLAGMDAKDTWRALEPELERVLREAETAGHELAVEMTARLRSLRQSIERAIDKAQKRPRPKRPVKRTARRAHTAAPR
jgi:hypothetical protein